MCREVLENQILFNPEKLLCLDLSPSFGKSKWMNDKNPEGSRIGKWRSRTYASENGAEVPSWKRSPLLPETEAWRTNSRLLT